MERSNREEKYSIFTIHMNNLLHHYAVKGIVSKVTFPKNCLSFLIEPESEAELLSIDPLKIVDHKQEQRGVKEQAKERRTKRSCDCTYRTESPNRRHQG